MFCRKCGFQMLDDAVFCPKCGERVQEFDNADKSATEVKTASEAAATAPKKHNVFAFVLLGLSVWWLFSTIYAIGYYIKENGAALFHIMSFLFVPVAVLVVSIICIAVSKKVVRHRGRAYGIVSLVLSSVFVVGFWGTAILAAFMGYEPETAIDKNVRMTAEKACGIICQSLNDPKSFEVYNVAVDVIPYDSFEITFDHEAGRTRGEVNEIKYYVAYIDYSSINAMGATARKVDSIRFSSDFKVNQITENVKIPLGSSCTRGVLVRISANDINGKDYRRFFE